MRSRVLAALAILAAMTVPAAAEENATQQIVPLPDALAVGADYGLTVMNGASVPAFKFALFILSAEGQRTLARHGFAAPALTQ